MYAKVFLSTDQNQTSKPKKTMRSITSAIGLLSLLVLFPCINAFYFYSNGGERKCFYKELSKNTLLQGVYSVQQWDEGLGAYRTANGNEISVVIDVEEAFDDNHRVVHQKGLAEGDFTFTALDTGEHKICIQPQASGWLAKVKTKVDLEFEVGSDSKLDSKRKKTVQTLQNKIQVLSEKVEKIREEQTLVREREANFRNASESANSRAMWWTIIQTIVLGGTCAWQLRHLRSFFVKQKVL
ncbi:LAMI_0D05952g1_1 [Lachancea mirantina]|uniref:LAMI_0D05952g1_1 n=1 Tax=Lachancea mirantina TaxID=1230905 RepID=A0A1G4JBD9_9SACH|nr:LAMI_0D05952g1_1 [Lachancea mirantina]